MAETQTPPIRTVVVYRVCQHWRAPMFARLNAHPEVELTVLHGRGIPGTKLVNGTDLQGFAHREMFTLSGRAKSSSRTVPWVWCPFVWWELWRIRPDVIVVEGGSNVFTNFGVYAYAKLFGRPVVWWTLGELPGRTYRGISRIYRGVVTAMERSASTLLGYSTVALDYFRRMGYDESRCFRAVNVVETDRIQQQIEQLDAEPAQVRGRHALGDGPVVLFVGALTAAKKIDRLLRAFAHVANEHPTARLLIVGDGPDRERLEGLANDLAPDSVVFAGQVIDGVAPYFAAADVFVLPGLGGLAVSEALTHGLPVVCARGDGCEVDLVRTGETGFRIDSNDDAAVTAFITDSLQTLLANPQQLAQMQAAARRIIADEINVGTYIENIVKAIRHARDSRRR